MVPINGRPRRTAVRIAAVVLAIAAAGVSAAGASAMGGSAATASVATAHLGYTCMFPDGPQRVAVTVSATFPGSVAVGHSVRPEGATVTAVVPRAAAKSLGVLGAASVAGDAELALTVAQAGSSSATVWPGLALRQAALEPAGGLVLSASGTAPPLTAGARGDLTVSAGGLALMLALKKADGTAVRPASLPVLCTPAPGRQTRIVTVPVSGGTPRVAGRQPSALPPAVSGQPSQSCSPLSLPEGLIGSAFLTGYSNATKLNGAALVGPGPRGNPRAAVLETTPIGQEFNICVIVVNGVTLFNTTFYNYNVGQLDYQGKSDFPPARATFLSYGFVPTTATLQISQVPLDCRDFTGKVIGRSHDCLTTKVVSDTYPAVFSAYNVTAVSEVVIRLSDVKVNGVPLDVGPHCQTAAPAKVVLSADNSATYSLASGGPLAGTFAIPRFTDCGVGENLNPLFDSSISGSGNYLKLTQGDLCNSTWISGTIVPAPNVFCVTGEEPGTPGHPFGVPNAYPIPQR